MGFLTQTTFGFDIEPDTAHILPARHHSTAKSIAMRNAADDSVRPERASVAGSRNRNIIDTQLTQRQMRAGSPGGKFLSTPRNGVTDRGRLCWMKRFVGR